MSVSEPNYLYGGGYTCPDCGYASLGSDDHHDCLSVLKAEVERLRERESTLVEAIGAFDNILDASDYELLGWSCTICQRRSEVKNPKVECDFGQCRENFMEMIKGC